MIKDFLDYLEKEKRYSPHTVLSYSTDLSQFKKFLAGHQLKMLDANHLLVRSWIVHLMEEGMKSKSVNRKISSLRSFYNYLKRGQKITINPTAKVRSPKIPKRLPEHVRKKDMDVLLEDIIFPVGFEGVRDKLMIEVLYMCGIRRAELMGLRLSDLHLDQHQIKVMGKGSKERLIPLGKELTASFIKYLELRAKINEEDTSVFLTKEGKAIYPKLVYNVVKKYLSQVTSLKKRSPHILRHSFATHLTNAGAELKAVKELLGHSSLAATQVYTHNSIERLKNVHSQAHPKGK